MREMGEMGKSLTSAWLVSLSNHCLLPSPPYLDYFFVKIQYISLWLTLSKPFFNFCLTNTWELN
jgi:hypothetical protein